MHPTLEKEMEQNWKIILYNISKANIGTYINSKDLTDICKKLKGRYTYVRRCFEILRAYNVIDRHYIKQRNIKNTWSKLELEKYMTEEWRTWFMKLD